MWESPQQVLSRAAGPLALLYFALEQAVARTADLFQQLGTDQRRFAHHFSSQVRVFAWEVLDECLAEGSLYAWSEGNAGIAALAGRTEIRVLHEADGGLPPAQSDRRRAFYSQHEQLSIFDRIDSGPRRIANLVMLWGETDGRLWVQLIAPRRSEALRDPIWAFDYEHPLSRATADFASLAPIDGHDGVDEIQLLTDATAAPETEPVDADEVDLIDPEQESDEAEGTDN